MPLVKAYSRSAKSNGSSRFGLGASEEDGGEDEELAEFLDAFCSGCFFLAAAAVWEKSRLGVHAGLWRLRRLLEYET